MSSEEQWQDAYAIAEQLYKENKPAKRSDLDPFQQIVCSRYDLVFSYDPIADSYSFRNQEITFHNAVPPKCREIADIDLDELRKNTMGAMLDDPMYNNLTPLYFVAPSTLLVFNNTQHRAYGLTDALETAAHALGKRPTERDILPGAQFLYKHKDGKTYRVMILKEVGEVNIPDGDRSYKVAFLDVCQVINLKLKHMHMPIPELSLDRFPCVVQCARFIGVKTLRPGYIPSFQEEISKFYDDKEQRRIGISSYIYTTDEAEHKLIIDFPSFSGDECTEATALVAVHGYYQLTDQDPIPLSYEEMTQKIIQPLQYNRQQEEYLSDSEFGSLTSNPMAKSLATGECPGGMASLDKFFKQVREMSAPKPRQEEVATASSASVSVRASPSAYDALDELAVSIRRAVNTAPLLDVPHRDEVTPTKVASKPATNSAASRRRDESPNGWEQETVRKLQPPPSPTKMYQDVKKAFGTEDSGWEHKEDTLKESTQEPNARRQLVAPKEQQLQMSTSPTRDLPSIRRPSFIQVSPSRQSSSHLSPPRSLRMSSSNMDMILNHRASSSTSIPQHSPMDVPIIEHEQPVPPTSSTADTSKNQRVIESNLNLPWLTPTRLEEDSQVEDQTNGEPIDESRSIRVADLNDDAFDDVPPIRRHSQRNEHQMESEQEKKALQEEALKQRMSNKLIDAFESHRDMKLERLKQRIREEVKRNEAEAVAQAAMTAVRDNANESFSSDRSTPSYSSEPTVDEFADVPEAIRQLAGAFVSSLQDAAYNSDRQSFVCDVCAMEVIALKSTGDLEKRFWKKKISENKFLEAVFQ